MAKPSLLAEYLAALDVADRTAEDLIVLEADAIADGDEADLERANAEWETIMSAYWTGNEVEDRLRARLLVESLVLYAARALRRVAGAESAA